MPLWHEHYRTETTYIDRLYILLTGSMQRIRYAVNMITTQAERIRNDILQVQIPDKLPIELTDEQEEKLSLMIASIRRAALMLREAHERKYILQLLNDRVPVKARISAAVSYLSTVQNYIAKALSSSDEAIDKWIEVKDMDGEWDMCPEGEQMVARNMRIETTNTKTQVMRNRLEALRNMRLVEQAADMEVQQSMFIGQNEAINFLSPMLDMKRS
ncbi:hypothetical protein BJ878DRAFT_538943 [Calycina marina]|uniref:Uncharacterized protein n=1 Tax=Calycina marina TaxID=1763456 RepID=A0A9P7ZA52_9HELO|nr:hypothetical protein BJ878DRAFT_538943 [Calycina marina]